LIGEDLPAALAARAPDRVGRLSPREAALLRSFVAGEARALVELHLGVALPEIAAREGAA
jgi:hypothetical protein